MTIDLHPLLIGEKDSIDCSFEYDIKELSIDFDSAVAEVRGTVHNHAGYLYLECGIDIKARALCGRCDEHFDWAAHYDMRCPVATHLENADEHDEYIIAEDGKLDITEAVRCYISLELPLKFLCRDDCKGLCPVCGHNLNTGDCGCNTKETDPRWSALKDYFNN